MKNLALAWELRNEPRLSRRRHDRVESLWWASGIKEGKSLSAKDSRLCVMEAGDRQ
jgi:hypothetical protein